MATSGLFTREDLRKGPAPATQGISVERLREMGAKATRNMNPRAMNPDIEPDGAKRPQVYFLRACPSVEEDKRGRAFDDRQSGKIFGACPTGWQDLARMGYVVGTLPPKGREPNVNEIECFRNRLIDDIQRAKPDVVVGFGDIPMRWLMSDLRCKMIRVRGRMFPVQIGTHVCWFMPTFDPSYVAMLEQSRNQLEKVPGTEWAKFWRADIERAFGRLDRPEIFDPARASEGVTIIRGTAEDFAVLRAFILKTISNGGAFGIDLETNGLRPYKAGAKILSIAITNGEGDTLAFPIDHHESEWSDQRRNNVLALVRMLLVSDVPRIAHNAPFDLEWLYHLFGYEIAKKGDWHCTQAQAYVLDEAGPLNLNYCCFKHFGFLIKQHSGMDRANLDAADLDDVLMYNGIDSKFTRKLYHRQRKLIKADGLMPCYRRQMERIPAFVDAQIQGVPVSQPQVRSFATRLGARIDKIEGQIKGDRVIRDYRERYGPFNPSAPQDCVKLLRDFLGRKEGNTEDGGFTTNEAALAQMTDLPVAKLILDYREVVKLASTYIDPLNAALPDTLIYPDGKLHPTFKLTWTDSGRSSCEDPNMQNFPKRFAAWIRKMIMARLGWSFLSFDFGALEARGIAMMSCDDVLVKSMWEDHDIHMDWAEKVCKADDRFYRKCNKEMKLARGLVKNKMVFPAFFLSSPGSIIRSLGIDDRAGGRLFEEFWDQFRGVKKWQKRMTVFYEEHGYVEGLTGRRRRGPLSASMIVNSPIQGMGSDIVISAMARLYGLAVEREEPWLAPFLNIHDDLTFHIPDQHLQPAAEQIIKVMCDIPEPWVNVPTLIEGSVGKNWFQMKEFGKFQSNRLEQDIVKMDLAA